MDWVKQHQKKLYIGGSILMIGILFYFIWFNVREVVTMENDSYVVNVNEELNTDISEYLQGMKDPKQASANWDIVDMKKVGIYDVTISYKGDEYLLHIDVRDMEKPHLELSKTAFSFSLNTSVEAINQTINEYVNITDNYDKEFVPITVVETIPDIAKEETYSLSVKDSSGNDSNVVEIQVTYTEVKQGEAITQEPSYANSVTTTPATNTAPSAQPASEPTNPVEKPTAPAGALEGIFASETEADAWIEGYISDPDSEWYCAVGFMRRLEDGTWWAYIQKTK